MKKRIFLGLLMAFGIFAISCDDDINGDGSDGNGETGTGVKKYVIAASSDLTDYLFVTDNLESGSLDLADGFETDKKATIWQWHNSNKYIYGLVYNQGNNGIVASYRLTSEGEVEKRSVEYNADRFTTHGSYDKYIITAAGVTTDVSDQWYSISGTKDSTVYAQGVTFVLFDAETQVRTPVTVSTENFLGDGEYVVFSGIVERDGKLYTAACPAGTSGYGAAQNNSEVTASTANPNRACIAIYNNLSFTNPTSIEDDRISYATGRYRSQYYSGLSLDDEGNLYVFSSSYDSTSKKPSGVVRIKAGTDEFDDFYFNIFDVFGLRLFKVWYITEDYFLVQLYSTEPINSDNARKLAIFKAGTAADGSGATLKEVVTGLPAHDNIASFGKVPYAEDGVIYMPVSSTEGYAIYKINPVTATATKGIAIANAEGGIGAVGIMEN
ncbi:MAG: DUF4374 domain-containing protein [Tannerellaceae bacterium]|nr:DUF4374 domain-containing protein [Tannerellaceae bacterium]